MKLTIILTVAILGVLQERGVHTFPTNIEDFEDPLVWPIPQRNGSILWMTEEEAEFEASLTEEHETTFGEKSDKVRFFLFTQQNPTESIELFPNDLESLMNSTFDAKNPTRFMIHGWLTDHRNVFDIKDALLLNGDKREFNFISVDWSVYSETINYISAKKHCSKAGEKVAELIDWLHEAANLSYETLAVYGHSLGAHVAGFTGKHVKHGRVHTIVGMDPAMPLFRIKRPEKRLAATDGEYVETIQTNGGLLGFYNPIGQAAFYPNGGKLQPGCGTDRQGSCSHGRSIAYFAEALSLGHKNGFSAIGCADFDSLKSKNCNQFSGLLRLGDPKNAEHANGIYYLETNSEAPYGIHILK
ncbi:phospholipase A1-like [Episyrphus balteatus]|uniref:phospholipase A1-like n=1 Tax=Episyrphus balteatus TaxID=286459 RepID=UPI00248694B6|nr:phospholipase A1-like [Episyrphus balteatus]